MTSMEKDLNRILEIRSFCPEIHEFKLHCPDIAQEVKPGQFLVLRIDERGERIPLTVVDSHPQEGWITIIFLMVGASTRRLGAMRVGDRIQDVVGPLGRPTHIDKVGTVVCLGGGIGVAPIFPIARGFHRAGNRVISIIGARSQDGVLLEPEMRSVSDEVLITTDDGSYGERGLITNPLARVLEREGAGNVAEVMAIGPVVMMRAVAELTRPLGVKTTVSLDSIMVDATGMCGVCRVDVGGKTKFACVDGPEFDAHQVDFDGLIKRKAMYRREEHRALWDHTCRLEKEAEKIKRGKIRIEMPKQDHYARRSNFNEVALGYTPEMAVREATRCVHCKDSPCIAGCPVEVDIPAFLKHIQKRDFLGAIGKLKEKNNLPAVCGRVCPQESQCELVCTLGKRPDKTGGPVAIGRLERFVADYELNQAEVHIPAPPASTGSKVAVIGAGPAGLTAAADLARMGHGVTIFEALHKPGGVLIYGIPEFRLPKRIVHAECSYIERLGVELRLNMPVGQISSVDKLLSDGYQAVFIATGAGLPYFLGIPGENLNGVYSANEFLTRNNLMKAYLFPEYDTPIRVGRHVGVIGGGNVAMDAARVAVRLGAKKVTLLYRRTRKEMPAREEEIVNALEEGVELFELRAPVRCLGDERGWLREVEVLEMELGEPDASGRRRPVPKVGSESIVPMDVLVVAVGQGPNPLLINRTPGLELNRWGNVVADQASGATSLKGVFAGGDIVTGAATVILAMGAGKQAARAIDRYLKTGEMPAHKK